MYIDHEGHRIATSTADAAGELTAHEQAEYFGYDCTGPCCAGIEDGAELLAAIEASDEFTAFVPGIDPWTGEPYGDEPPF